MTADMWQGLIRHVLTLVGGFMVSKGYVDESTMQAGIGAVATLVGIGWSVAAKK